MSRKRRNLKPGVIPSLNMRGETEESETSQLRRLRAMAREIKKNTETQQQGNIRDDEVQMAKVQIPLIVLQPRK